MFGAVRKFFHMGKINRLYKIPRHSRKNLPATHLVFIHRLAFPCARWQLDVQNCWALRHRQAFIPVSPKQNPVHVHTEILSRPGCAAASKSLSSISPRLKLTSMMAGDKNCNFPYVRRHELVHFITAVHDVSSFQNKKKTKTNR